MRPLGELVSQPIPDGKGNGPWVPLYASPRSEGDPSIFVMARIHNILLGERSPKVFGGPHPLLEGRGLPGGRVKSAGDDCGVVVMAVQIAKVGRVPPRWLAGWVVDDSYHVVITEKEAPPEALGQIRYPSEYPGSVQFPAEVGPTEAWEGWVDGLNIGDAVGDFRYYISSTSGCSGDLGMLDPVTVPAGQYHALQLTGTGPIDLWICWMRYVP